MQPSTESMVYEVPEIAVLLGISRNSAYDRVRDGTIPSVRLGRRIVIPRKAFDDWLDTAASSEPASHA